MCSFKLKNASKPYIQLEAVSTDRESGIPLAELMTLSPLVGSGVVHPFPIPISYSSVALTSDPKM